MKKIVVLCLILLTFNASSVLAASTDSTNVAAAIQGGSYSFGNLPNSISFSNITLNGTWQTEMSFFDNFMVVDATGTANGWKLDVSATRLTEIGGKNLSMPPGTLVVYAPTSVAAINGTVGPLPGLNTGFGMVDAEPFRIATAPSGTGMGSFKFGRIYLEIDIRPFIVLVDSVNYPNVPTPYESTITWSIVSGP